MSRLAAFRACAWPVASIDRPALDAVLVGARAHGPGAAVVTSCQRVEVFHTEECACGAPATWSGFDALLRLAEVTAGLHSLVLGEDQVVGQVRAGLAAAGDDVRALASIAIAAARTLRAESNFQGHSGHLLDRALHLAGVGQRGAIAIAGAGAMGGLVAQRATALGFREVTVIARRPPAYPWFDPARMRYQPLARVAELPAVDVLVCCLGSGAAPLAGVALPPVRHVVVDLGTPRTVTDAGGAPIVTIADMLAAEAATPHRDARRGRLQARLRELLAHRLAMADDGGSPVGLLRAEVERVREAEVRRIARLHPELPPETVETITRSLINHVFHRPTERLRAGGDAEFGQRLLQLFTSEEVLP